MSKVKRARGRPLGSGKDDSRYLAQVAELLVREPALTPTTAMRRVMRSFNDWDAASESALIRRWQGKWKLTRHALRAAGREHVRPRPAAAPHQPEWLVTEETVRAARAAFERSDFGQLRRLAHEQHQRMEKLRENLPFARMVREMQDSGIGKLMKQMENSPMNKLSRSAARWQRELAAAVYVNPSVFQGLSDTVTTIRRELERQIGQVSLGPINV